MFFSDRIGKVDELEPRIYYTMCVTGFIICGLFSVFNITIGLNFWLNTVLFIGMTVFGGLIYSYRKHGATRIGYYIFTSSSLIVVSFVWFLNGGIQSPIIIIFPVYATALLIISRHKNFWLLVMLFAAHFSLLYLLQRIFPEWIIHYEDEITKEIDILGGSVSAIVMSGYLAWLFKGYHETEREKLLKNKRILERYNSLLIKANKEAERYGKLQSEFLANMSHEIRTPLNGIIGMVELLHSSKVTKEQSEYIRTINLSSHLLLNLINDILDLSKLEANHVVLEKFNFNLKEVIHNVLDILSHRSKDKQFVFNHYIKEDVPAELCGDRNRLEQILVNLIGNAFKFTDEGEVRLEIYPLHQSDEIIDLEFRIIDTGIGISKKVQNNLFKRFYQVEGASNRKYTGTGLGLVISKNLIELMGGSISVDSEVGKGSSFIFNAQFEPSHKKNTPLEVIEPDTNTGVKPLKILVAEDNQINQLVIVKHLKKLGYKPDLAENGEKALEKVSESSYDLILMDVQMPKLDGIETTRSIRKNLNGVTQPVIIALTANAMKDDKHRCLQAGMNDYLSKPFTGQDLRRMINKWF